MPGTELLEDPTAEGIFGFANGVTVYAMNSPRASEYEAICERGVLTALNNGVQFRQRQVHEYEVAARTIRDLGDGTFPHYEAASSTLRLIEDLVAALDPRRPGDARRRARGPRQHGADLRVCRVTPARRGACITSAGRSGDSAHSPHPHPTSAALPAVGEPHPPAPSPPCGERE